jgi:hypothetical protein
MSEPFDRVPEWVLRPLPANAVTDAELERRIDALAGTLPDNLAELDRALREVYSFREYDSAANRASAHVWLALERLYGSGQPREKGDLAEFALRHMTERARARVLRRLSKDADLRVRSRVRHLVRRGRLHEVAIPAGAEGAWDASGWLHGVVPAPLARHRQGREVQLANGLPPLGTVGELRQLLGIRSVKQLGYFLRASDHEDGPYTRFTIPKRSGGTRDICAPKSQLRWVQRQVLDKILAKVGTHDAAHGFIAGRSTVTNAEQHKGAAVLVKFDLTDFFPTIHYYRVVGLFTRLGYAVGDARFRADDEAREVAPTLARLCCYTPEPSRWGQGLLPQGAPTSPTISNLVCRRLDARLDGLARGRGGVYTRYADDLTFSFVKDTVDLGRLRWWVDQVCHQEGFLINQRKFRVIRRSQRQLVTGIVVNDELRVPRDERRRFRAILHNCRSHGIESQARGRPRFREYLRGFASYVHMVQPEEGAALLREVEELLGPEAAGPDAEGQP